MRARNVNELIKALADQRRLGNEELFAVALVNGQPVRFAVVAVNEGDNQGELILELDRRTVAGAIR